MELVVYEEVVYNRQNKTYPSSSSESGTTEGDLTSFFFFEEVEDLVILRGGVGEAREERFLPSTGAWSVRGVGEYRTSRFVLVLRLSNETNEFGDVDDRENNITLAASLLSSKSTLKRTLRG